MTYLCETCPVRQTGICATMIGADKINPEIARERKSRTLPAKRYMQTPANRGEELRIIRHGWAASIATSSTGGAHISQVLLPGDPVGAALLPPNTPPQKIRTVRTLTPVEYCSFDAPFVRQLLMDHEWARELLFDITHQRALDLQARLADLGLRDAEGRIVSLLLEIYQRLEARGLASDGHCEFPMKQQSIGEATGLTQVHVSRVMKTLRERKLLWIDKKGLHIPDLERVRTLLS